MGWRACVLWVGVVELGALGIGCPVARAWEEAPEVTPQCHNCDDEPPSSSDTSVSVSSGTSSSSHEVNYDSKAYQFGQRIRQMFGLSSMYDYVETTAAESEAQRRWRTALDHNRGGLEAYQRGDWEQAAFAFRQALQYAPDNAVIQGNLRNAETQLTQVQDAQRLQETEASERRMRVQGVVDQLATALAAPAQEPVTLFEKGVQGSPPVDLRDRTGSQLASPIVERGSPGSAPVELRFMEDGTLPVVHPETVKGSSVRETSRTWRPSIDRIYVPLPRLVQQTTDLSWLALNRAVAEVLYDKGDAAWREKRRQEEARRALPAPIINPAHYQSWTQVNQAVIEVIYDKWEAGRRERQRRMKRETVRGVPDRQGDD